MTKRRMFLRMITASLLRRRSRMLIALLSIAVGATILSGLVTIYYDVPRQMGAQFRKYGANMLLMPGDGEVLTADKAKAALSLIPEESVLGATPYRYVRLDMALNQQSFTAAGTDFEQVQETSPYFGVEGRYPVPGQREVLVGKEVAQSLNLRLNRQIDLTYQLAAAEGDAAKDWVPGASLSGAAISEFNNQPVFIQATLDEQGNIASLTVDASTQTDIGQQCEQESYTRQFIGKALPLSDADVDTLTGATMTSQAVREALNTARQEGQALSAEEYTKTFTVVGILQTGGEEETYLFLSQEDLEAVTREAGRLDVVELSVTGDAEQLDEYVKAISESGLGVTARLVKRVTKSEASVLTKLQSLVFLVTAVVLILTMITVATTMTAVVTERRREIGLRKALGASDGSIRAEFLGEGMFLGLLGGVLGAILGFVFAQVVSVNVFGSSILFQWLLLPITVAVCMLIAALSCLLPIKRAIAIDPALVLKGE